MVLPTSSFSFPKNYVYGNDSTQSSVDHGRLALVIGGTAGIIAAAHLQNHNSWWRGDIGAFHLGEDGTPYLHQDKLGHFYFTYLSSDIIGRSFGWAGVEQSIAVWYGGAIALGFQTYVEIEDGFHPELGFSLGDETADILGAAWPIGQSKWMFLENIHPKWSVIESAAYRSGHYRTIIDDYESQYVWFSGNIRGLFGESTPAFVPSFVNVALGFGVKGILEPGGAHREVYLGLDVDWDKLPGDGSFLIALKHALNYIHTPAPTIRFTPHVVMYGLRF